LPCNLSAGFVVKVEELTVEKRLIAGFVEAVKNGLVLKTICAGDFVGEIAFLASCKHAFGLGQVCLAERTRVCDVVAGADGTECWEVCVCVCVFVCVCVCVCVGARVGARMSGQAHASVM